MKKIFIAILLIAIFGQMNAQNLIQKDDFLNPPQSSQINTWWHWISGNVSKDGITKDLESMKKQGVKQATILNIGSGMGAKLDMPQVKFNSPKWYEMFQFALEEASRLGLTIGVHNCDGWSASGGPWITNETSMKTVTWSKSYFTGDRLINATLQQPEKKLNYYVDYAVLAFPSKAVDNSFQRASPDVWYNGTSSQNVLCDGNPNTKHVVREGDSILFSFEEAFTANKLNMFRYFIRPSHIKPGTQSSYALYASNDGVDFAEIATFDIQGINKPQEQTFPETTAKFFKLKVLNSTFRKNQFISELELLSTNESPSYAPAIKNYYSKMVRMIPETNLADYTEVSSDNNISEDSIIDITAYMSADGKLNWEAPKGDWCVIRFGYTTTGVRNQPATPEGHGLECDKMDASVVDLHFNSFPNKLVEASGDHLGNTFKFLLIDSWECQYANWTKKFPEEFEKRRGYSLKKWIPVLCGESVGSVQQSDAFLHDFRKTIGDLTEDNYYKHFSELCHENKLEMHAEVIYGKGKYPPLDVLSATKYVDMPMTEFWAFPDADRYPAYKSTSGPLSLFPTYAAFTCDKQIIGSEAYTGYAEYSETPALLKPFGDMIYCLGVNQLILHSMVHQPNDNKPGVTLGKFGGAYNRNNPWWELSQGWMTYQARVQYMLQHGTPHVDVVTYVGDRQPQSLLNINKIPFGYSVYPCTFEMLNEQAAIVDGKLSFNGKQQLPFLALPDDMPMELATLKKIAALVNDGLVLCGEKPTVSYTLSDLKTNSVEFDQLVAQLWGSEKETQYGKGKVINIKKINEMIPYLEMTPDFTTNTNDPKELKYIHKIIGEQDVYFVFNQTGEAISRELLFKVKDKTAEIWRAEHGTTTSPAIYAVEGEQTRIPVTFKANESMFFVFNNTTTENHIDKVMLSGKQIFPSETIDNFVEVPTVKFLDDDYYFTSNVDGDYTFSSVSNEEIEISLTQSETFEILDYNALLEFTSIADEDIAPVEITELKSLTEFDNTSIKYFSGTVKYTIQFKAPKDFVSTDAITLNLGDIDATAEVRLNGQLINYAWLPNSEINVSGILEKKNELVITLANVCRNRMIGDKVMYNEFRNIFTTVKYNDTVSKDLSLNPSGVMGPLTLKKVNVQN